MHKSVSQCSPSRLNTAHGPPTLANLRVREVLDRHLVVFLDLLEKLVKVVHGLPVKRCQQDDSPTPKRSRTHIRLGQSLAEESPLQLVTPILDPLCLGIASKRILVGTTVLLGFSRSSRGRSGSRSLSSWLFLLRIGRLGLCGRLGLADRLFLVLVFDRILGLIGDAHSE